MAQQCNQIASTISNENKINDGNDDLVKENHNNQTEENKAKGNENNLENKVLEQNNIDLKVETMNNKTEIHENHQEKIDKDNAQKNNLIVVNNTNKNENHQENEDLVQNNTEIKDQTIENKTDLNEDQENADLAQAVLLNENENNLYSLLSELHTDKLVIYPDEFDCPICLCDYKEMEGIILKECLHVFCRMCLVNTIQASETADVVCPFRNEEYSCPSYILEHEIQSLLPKEDYEDRLSKTLAFAEARIPDSFHCKTPDCKGWCIIDGTNVFECPVCSCTNCITCKAIHTGLTCQDYLDVVTNKSESLASKQSEIAIKDLVQVGEAMHCPNCNGVVSRVMGCDALTCTFCKTQLCWATKGARWGPGGQGDTSGGCRCNFNGVRCHPNCVNCH